MKIEAACPCGATVKYEFNDDLWKCLPSEEREKFRDQVCKFVEAHKNHRASPIQDFFKG